MAGQTLKIEHEVSDRTLVLKLIGQIDENADYSSVSFTSIEHMIIDFSGVTLINSLGIQRWIIFLDKIPSQIKIKFAKCPLRVINQINLFPDFSGKRGVKIDSFYAPYYCEACDESFTFLLKTPEHFRAGMAAVAPKQQCPSCSGQLQFDGIEEKFFKFLKNS